MSPSVRRDIEDRDTRILEHLARAGAFTEDAAPALVKPATETPDGGYHGPALKVGRYQVPLCAKLSEVARWGKNA